MATPSTSSKARSIKPRQELTTLAFENTFVRELPGDPVLTNVPRQVRNAALHARRSDAGRRAAAARLVGRRRRACWASPAPSRARGQRRSAGRQSRAARHAALRRALRRTPVRQLGRAARRRPRDHARRSHRHRRQPLRAAAEGRRPHALFAHRRRPRGAALFGARVHVQRGDALPRRADHARAEPRRHRRSRHPRHVLRRQPRSPSPARSCAASRRRSCASAISRSSPRSEELERAASGSRTT